MNWTIAIGTGLLLWITLLALGGWAARAGTATMAASAAAVIVIVSCRVDFMKRFSLSVWCAPAAFERGRL